MFVDRDGNGLTVDRFLFADGIFVETMLIEMKWKFYGQNFIYYDAVLFQTWLIGI